MIIKRFKKAIASFVAAAFVGTSATAIPTTTEIEHYYAATFKIIDLEHESNTIVFIDANGNIWEYEGIEDWELGDTASVLMLDNGTTNIYDDKIVSMRYSSWRID